MTQRKSDGATLALVVALTILLVIIGVCFFVWNIIIGGGKELQHATDSGNLAVARNVLRRPAITLIPGPEMEEFGDLTTNNEVTLLNFNRLVGKVVLAQMNARASDFNGLAIEHAQNLTRLVEGQNGIGQRLHNAIVAQGALKQHFENLAQSNSTRMLSNTGVGNVQDVVAETDFAYMARNKASNVYFDESAYPGNIPPASTDVIDKQVNGANRKFLVGYRPFSTATPASCPVTWAVPMRPGEQPHLVTVTEFKNNRSAQAGNNMGKDVVAGSLCAVLPNTYQSGGKSNEFRTGQDMTMRSCAIIGVLDQIYPIEMTRGVIVVDNTGYVGAFNGTIPIGGGNNIFETDLMSPNCVDLVRLRGKDGTVRTLFAKNPGGAEDPVARLKQSAKDTFRPGSAPEFDPFPASLISQFHSKEGPDNTVDGDAMFMAHMIGNGSYQSQYPRRNELMPVTVQQENCCSNLDFGGSPNVCTECAGSFVSAFGGGGSGSGYGSGDGLMALEEYVLRVLSGWPGGGNGSGCNIAQVPPRCSGLKEYTTSGGNFAVTNHNPSLAGLLSMTDSDGSVRASIRERFHQMKNGITAGEIDAVMGQSIPFNTVRFIYPDPANNNTIRVAANPPSWLKPWSVDSDTDARHPSTGLPDGARHRRTNNNFQVSGTAVPFPIWECGDGQSSAHNLDKADWWPSSGQGHLLGVVRFGNCPYAGGDNWCCP